MPTTIPPATPATTPVAPASTPSAAPPAARPPYAPPVTPRAPTRRASRWRRPATRRIVAALVVLLLVAGIVRVLRPSPLPVETALVVRRPMRVTVHADALTRVVARFVVTAPVSGSLDRLALREGMVVRAGDVVAIMSTAPAHPTERAAAVARLDAARALARQGTARLGQAAAALAQAERDGRRTGELVAGGALPERDVERAALEIASRRGDVVAAGAALRMARAELAQARAAMEAASQAGARTIVRAPASGVVLRVPEPSARVVAAGTSLLEIGDPTSLEVTADVLSSDATAIRSAQSVELRGWGGAPLHGVVRRIEPSARTRVSALGVEEQRLTVVIDLFDPPAVLGDGYRLDAGIIVWTGARVLSVPASALLREGEGWSAYAIERDRAVRRAVSVGHLGDGLVEIVDGLAPGDTVIAFPPDALRGGARVAPVAAPDR